MKRVFRFKRAMGMIVGVIMAICCFQTMAFGDGGGIVIKYAAEGAVFDLYRIGSFSSNGGLKLEGEFAKYEGISINEETAATLEGYAERDGINKSYSVTTGSDKCGRLSNPENGCYLITGEKTTVGKVTYTPMAALVSYTGELLEVNPKYNSEKEPDEPNKTTVSRSVMKQWVNVPDDVVHPEYVVAQLLKNGAVYAEVELSDSNSWKYEWTGLDSDYTWTVVEKYIPYHYTGGVTQDGNLFVITNTYKPVTPSGGGGGGGGNEATTEEEETEATTVGESTTESGNEGTTEESEGTTEENEGTTEETPETPTENTPETPETPDTPDTPSGDTPGGDTPSGDTPGGETPQGGEETPVNPDDESSYGRNRDRYYYDKDGNPITEEEWLEEQERERKRLLADKLPQTGLLWWPVPVMAGFGVLFILVGMLRQDDEDKKKK